MIQPKSYTNIGEFLLTHGRPPTIEHDGEPWLIHGCQRGAKDAFQRSVVAQVCDLGRSSCVGHLDSDLDVEHHW